MTEEERRRKELEQQQAYSAEVDNANQARAAAYNNAQRLYQARIGEGYNDFADIIKVQEDSVSQEEEQARQQQEADLRAARWAGATEMATSIANLVGVGSFGASNQQYGQYSQGWMKKADQDMKEARQRVGSMRERQRALRQQMSQMRMGEAGNAYNSAIRMADAAYQHNVNAAAQRYQEAEKLSDREWQREINEREIALKEQAQERADKQADATIAQGWARINDSKATRDANMMSYGFIPDPEAPGGYRYDPSQAAKGSGARSSSSSSSGSGSGVVSYPIIDARGEVNIAHLKPQEMEAVLLNAREAIRTDLGDANAADFIREFRMAADDKEKNSVLMKWMKKSRTCGDMLREIDNSYVGYHDSGEEEPGVKAEDENRSGYNNVKARRASSTGDLINSL